MESVQYVIVCAYKSECGVQLVANGTTTVLVPAKGGYQGFDDCQPVVWDLANMLHPKTQFQVHTQVGDQHIHSSAYEYQDNAGVFCIGIKDEQGNCDHFYSKWND